MVMVTEEGSTEIVNFMIPGVGVLGLRCRHISYIVKIHYFFKNLLLYTKELIRQTEGIVTISKEGSVHIVNFMIPKGRNSCARVAKCYSYTVSIRQ